MTPQLNSAIMNSEIMKLLEKYLAGKIKDRARRHKIRDLAYQARAADIQDREFYRNEIKKNISMLG